jgi:hypothetical protein
MTTMTMTISKTFRGGDDLIILPRREYESLKARVIPEYTATQAERRALLRAQKEYRAGKFITLDELKKRMARRHR